MRLWIASLVVFSLGFVACKRVEAPPASGSSTNLAERVRARILQIDPKMTVIILDEDSLEAKDGAFDVKVSLDNVKRACVGGDQECRAMIDALIANLTQAFVHDKDIKKMVAPADVRYVIKPTEWVASAEQMFASDPADMRKANEILTAPFAEGLSIVYVVDMPAGMRMLTNGDLVLLKLDHKQVDALARKNLEAAFPKVKMSEMEHTGVWTNAEGNDYDAALIALPHLWKPLADQLGGLVVSIPARNRVFAAGAKGNLDALRKVTQIAAKEEPHRISDQLFVWSARGFTPLAR